MWTRRENPGKLFYFEETEKYLIIYFIDVVSVNTNNFYLILFIKPPTPSYYYTNTFIFLVSFFLNGEEKKNCVPYTFFCSVLLHHFHLPTNFSVLFSYRIISISSKWRKNWMFLWLMIIITRYQQKCSCFSFFY